MNDLQDADDDLVPTLTSQEVSADLDEETQDFRFLSHLSQYQPPHLDSHSSLNALLIEDV